MARKEGWTTIELAIVGGAKSTAIGYKDQPTLFEMRWSPSGAHQYASDVKWAYSQAERLYSIFTEINYDGGNNFRYPSFKA